MKANYHTHTARCGHAIGSDEDYVRAAVAQGFEELGFSDHVPWPYASGYTHPTVRMTIGQMDGYIASVRALERRYAGKIAIRLGFECEYFPAYMGWLADMREERGLDYLILGNHYDLTDEGGMYFGSTRTPAQLRTYVEVLKKRIAKNEESLSLWIKKADADMLLQNLEELRADAERMIAFRQENEQGYLYLLKYYALRQDPEGIQRVICDYIAGMTDKYAVSKFSELFIPTAWQVRG